MVIKKILSFPLVSRITLTLFFTASISCGKGAPLGTGLRPDMRIKNFSSVNYMHGSISWELKAEKSSYYFDENRSIAEDVLLHYYKDEAVSAVVNSDQAIIYTDSNDIDLIGNVDILSTAGNRLLTSRIKWNSRDKYLDTDDPVTIIRRNGDIIKGTGLRANYDLEDYEIKRKIVAITRRIKDNSGTREKR